MIKQSYKWLLNSNFYRTCDDLYLSQSIVVGIDDVTQDSVSVCKAPVRQQERVLKNLT